MKIDAARMSVSQQPYENKSSSADVDESSGSGYISTGGVSNVAGVLQVESMSNDKELVDDNLVDKSIQQANKTLKGVNRHIERSVHEVTRAVMYVIKDDNTGEVIGEFPPRKIQDMIAKMWELAGLVIDEKL